MQHTLIVEGVTGRVALDIWQPWMTSHRQSRAMLHAAGMDIRNKDQGYILYLELVLIPSID